MKNSLKSLTSRTDQAEEWGWRQAILKYTAGGVKRQKNKINEAHVESRKQP